MALSVWKDNLDLLITVLMNAIGTMKRKQMLQPSNKIQKLCDIVVRNTNDASVYVDQLC